MWSFFCPTTPLPLANLVGGLPKVRDLESKFDSETDNFLRPPTSPFPAILPRLPLAKIA
jgi:hypothetical protein